MENLEDFLKDSTQTFVDEIFAKFGTPVPRPAASNGNQNTQSAFTNAQRPFTTYGREVNGRDRAARPIFDGKHGKRKRSMGQDGSMRPAKPQRGKKRTRQQLNAQAPSFQMPSNGQMNMNMPMPTPNFPLFDPSDPMAVMAFQAMMQTFMMGGPRPRCVDYDTKGFCPRGRACPFQHGEMTVEENPAQSMTGSNTYSKRGGRGAMSRISGGGRSSKQQRHADFSDPGPNYDTALATIVVERIPRENFEEEQVRDFFSQYGKVNEVSMQAPKSLALVKYDSYESARRAYDSPKVVFDNRFVKVYWYKPDKNGLNGRPHRAHGSETGSNDTEIDMEEFSKQQEAAQQAFEERKAKIEANAEARRDLQMQYQQLSKKHEAERKDLLSRLARAEAKKRGKYGSNDGDEEDEDDEDAIFLTKDPKERERVKVQKALRDQLALLEAEAKSLGIDPDAPVSFAYSPSSTYYSPRGRGGYRGRCRGRGHSGALTWNPRSSGSVIRLDNRPRRIAISIPEGGVIDTDKDEALRHYLLSSGEYESIEQDPQKPQGQGIIVTYKERYQAEMLIARGTEVAGIGRVEMKWVPNAYAEPGSNGETTRRDGRGDNEDEEMSDGEVDETEEAAKDESNGYGHGLPTELDFDVASDDDYDNIT